MVQTHKPIMLDFLERTMTDHKQLLMNLKFDTHIQPTVNGLSSEIAMMLKKDIVKMENITIV